MGTSGKAVRTDTLTDSCPPSVEGNRTEMTLGRTKTGKQERTDKRGHVCPLVRRPTPVSANENTGELIVTNENCALFEDCEAPLCPLHESALSRGVWYADESICRAKRFQSLPWVKKQKRIAKLGLTVDDGSFTVRMLDSIQVITRNLKGADPDDFGSEQKWLKYRAEKRG